MKARNKTMKLIKHLKPLPCPVCSSENPTAILTGDNKHGFIVRCVYCGYTAARFDELRFTKRGAIKVWNHKIEQIQKGEPNVGYDELGRPIKIIKEN